MWKVLVAMILIASSSGNAGEVATRALRIGPSASLLASSIPLGTAAFGPGVWTSYEFLATPRFHLGIHASFRNYSSTIDLRQLTYGLLLKHAFAEADSPLVPYAEYGLLMNMNFLSDRPGSGVSHNTRLAAGAEFEIREERFFADLAYNYSRLGFFGTPKLNLDSFELATGWRHRW